MKQKIDYKFQYPLFRIVVLSPAMPTANPAIVQFQYPLFRIVVLSSSASRRLRSMGSFNIRSFGSLCSARFYPS